MIPTDDQQQQLQQNLRPHPCHTMELIHGSQLGGPHTLQMELHFQLSTALPTVGDKSSFDPQRTE